MIVGITGTLGAGKGTIVEFLVQRGFTHYSASAFVAEEVRRRGLPVNRDTLHQVGNDIRIQNHPAFITRTNYERAVQKGGDAVIESIRGIAAANFLKERGGILFGVDADRNLRYERVRIRAEDKDAVTYEQFCEQEDKELGFRDPNGMNIIGAMQLADVTFQNNGTKEELFTKIEKTLATLREKAR